MLCEFELHCFDDEYDECWKWNNLIEWMTHWRKVRSRYRVAIFILSLFNQFDFHSRNNFLKICSSFLYSHYKLILINFFLNDVFVKKTIVIMYSQNFIILLMITKCFALNFFIKCVSSIIIITKKNHWEYFVYLIYCRYEKNI